MHLVIQLFIYDIEQTSYPFQRILKLRRQGEINKCFIHNIQHPDIEYVHVLCENEETAKYYSGLAANSIQKMKFVVMGHQPTYKEFLEYISRSIPEGEAVCIMNSDVYFATENLQSFLDRHLLSKRIFGLTRHEYTTDDVHSVCNKDTCPLVYIHRGSHDAFIFRTPIPSSIDLESINHPQNVFGAENIFLHAWNKAGHQVLNPCYEIVTVHVHKDRVYFKDYPRINVGREYFCDQEPCPDDTNTLIKLPDRLDTT